MEHSIDLFKLSSCVNRGIVGSVPKVLDRGAGDEGSIPCAGPILRTVLK